jgi:hypothetical protein
MAQDDGDANHRARMELEASGGNSSSFAGGGDLNLGGDFGNGRGERNPRDTSDQWRGGRDRDDHDGDWRDRRDRGGTRIIIGGGYWTGPDWGERRRHDHWDRWDHRHRHYRYPDPWVRYWAPPRPRYYGYYDGWPAWYGRSRTVIVWSVFPPFIYDRLPYRARGYHEDAYSRAMSAPVGQSVNWTDSGAAGTITTTRDGWAGERYCREFRQNVVIAGQNQEAWGTACQQPDGSWQLVKENE